MARPRRSWFVGMVLVIAALAVATARPAGADPARPTDYESRVLRVAPPLPDGFEIAVVGGDAFLELQVPRGHTAEVPDYGPDSPPYLRFRADGTVERNANATATALNESRYGARDGSSPSDTPRWEVVARNGRYVWHDHRIHWMSPIRATPIDERSGRIDMGGPDGVWEVELTVDGTPTVVTGELVLHSSPSPVPWIALLTVVAAGLIAGAAARARRRPTDGARRVLAGVLLVASLLALLAGAVEWRSLPGPAGRGPLSAVIPGVAVLGALLALLSHRAAVQRAALAGSIAALGGWAWLRRDGLARAVLPTSFPDPLDRTATALALGVAVAGAVVLVWLPPRDPAPAEPASTIADEG